MSQALYRKYRSKSLADVVGQDHITDILARAIKNDKIAHAYLLTGPRGVGKTSIARILAHEINKLPYTEDTQHLDIIEIDAASNNGVEDVRDLREKVQLAPVSANKKVYIIDEVHMLSKPAFNALLKTLEEPPAHVVFILATTDVEKIPATIVSRTQRYGFRAISVSDAVKHLRFIADKEGITIADDALTLIAERGDGSFRDSISLLDQLSSLAGEKETVTVALIEASLGLAPAEVVTALLAAVDKHDVTKVATLLNEAEQNGTSATVLTQQLVAALQRQAATRPQVLHLLDALLDVPKSAQPAMKLLSVLGMAAYETKPKHAALVAPAPEITATVEELSKQATKKHPKVAPVVVAENTIETPATPRVAPTADFDWAGFVEHTRQHYVALYSVISKCGYEVDGSTILLYANNAFYKKKLDDPKYSPMLYDSLKALGITDLVFEELPDQAPRKSIQAASIADIMGGGTEVTL